MSYQYGSYHRVQNLTGPASSVYNYYDSLRGTLSSKYSYATPSWNTVSSYVYGTPNAIGQPTSVDAYGTAFSSSDTADWQWKYNLRGELASARNQPLQASSTASRFYEFDGIGNRQRQRQGVFADAGGTLTSYTPNALNQYTTITTASTVYPYHDPDGNMTSGPLPASPTGASLGWNGENRLSYISPWVSGSAWAYYLHDALGRRVMKTVTPSGGSATRTYAIYDGWNLLAEYTGAVHTTGTPPLATLQRSYAWGTDLSGTAQGAGGVGGLLAAQLHTGPNMGVYYPTYDGNGNVSEYLNSTGGVAAHYEYGPFGEPLVSTGSVATQMPFRFSTKYQDAETGLLYYGFRYYDPNTGRWLSRDPIGEQGGVNLYGMVGNDAVNRFDFLGLADILVEMSRTYHTWDTLSEFTAKTTDDKFAACCKEVKGQTIELKKGEYWLVKQGDYFYGNKNYPIPEGDHTGTWSHSDPTSIRAIVSPINSGITENYNQAMAAYQQAVQQSGGGGAPNLLVRIFGKIGQAGGPSPPGRLTLYGIPDGEFGTSNILVNAGGSFTGTRMHIGENCNWSRGCPIVGKNAQLRTTPITIYEGSVGKEVQLHNFTLDDSYDVATALGRLVLCVKKQLGKTPTIEVKIK